MFRATTTSTIIGLRTSFARSHSRRARMVSQLTLNSKIKLRDGNEIPLLGFGTYEMDGKTAYHAVTWALEAGYRHIDSAAWYENERECGQAILDFCTKKNLPRSEIFFTTKLKLNNGYESVKRSIQRSLTACRLDYIDLYLIHGPIGGPDARKASWRAVCEAQKSGILKSIGISNFGVRHMQEILDEGVPLPAINQIEVHPFNAQKEIVPFCKKHDIAIEAWGPLVRSLRFEHNVIVSLAQKYNKDPAHILLRFSVQKGYIPLPKSQSKERITSNTEIFDFELTEAEVALLESLDEGLITDWDPTEEP